MATIPATIDEATGDVSVTDTSFAATAARLSVADSEARAAAGDASEARAKRSTAAVESIVAAANEKIDGAMVRMTLLGAGVLKGTVSKIVTVVEAIDNGVIKVEDVKSLNGAYNAVKAFHKAATAASPGAKAAAGVAFATAPAGGTATSPAEAFDIIINAIKSVTDPDEAFRLGGEWITKITNGITSALEEREDEEDDE